MWLWCDMVIAEPSIALSALAQNSALHLVFHGNAETRNSRNMGGRDKMLRVNHDVLEQCCAHA